MNTTQYNQQTETLLQYLRGEARAERMSWGELATLQGLADYILKYHGGDIELLELAGVPERMTNADRYGAYCTIKTQIAEAVKYSFVWCDMSAGARLLLSRFADIVADAVAEEEKTPRVFTNVSALYEWCRGCLYGGVFNAYIPQLYTAEDWDEFAESWRDELAELTPRIVQNYEPANNFAPSYFSELQARAACALEWFCDVVCGGLDEGAVLERLRDMDDDPREVAVYLDQLTA